MEKEMDFECLGSDEPPEESEVTEATESPEESEAIEPAEASRESEADETAEPTEEPEYILEEPMNPSDVFQGFLDYLKLCQEEYQTNIQEVWRHDRALQDDVHAFEFAETDEEAAGLGIEFSAKRKERRRHKDEAYRYEEGAKFCADKSNRPFLERIRSMIERQEHREEYLDGDRFYRPRGGENDGEN